MYMNLLFTFSTHKSSVGKNNNIEKKYLLYKVHINDIPNSTEL